MRAFCLIAVVFLHCHLFSQSGCTDPLATNYNSAATSNNGSCLYATATMICHLKGALTPSVPESSGLLYSNGVVWTHNDSGNQAELFKVDTANGAILQKVSILNHANTDWEDIAADSTYLYIGDFGNNDGMRTDLKILRIRKDSISSNGNTSVNATAINFSYSDQTSFANNSSTNFDCEAFISIGNSLYLFSKNRGDFQTRVYKLSKTPGTYVLTPYTTFNVNGEITGADYNPQTKEIALIGYLSTKKNSFVWFLNDYSGDLFFSGNKRRVEIGNATAKWQTEGITYAANGEILVSCETSDYPAGLYSAVKPYATPVGIKEEKNISEEIKIYPNPSEHLVTIKSRESIKKVELFSTEGHLCYSSAPNQFFVEITQDKFTGGAGIYFLKIYTDSGLYSTKLVRLQGL